MTTGAYAPPTAPLSDAPPAPARLYNLNQIATAAWLGSPAAGVWLIASNYRELGDPKARRRTLGWGFLATAVILAFQLSLPQRAVTPLTALAALLTRSIASQLQRDVLAEHTKAKRAFQSWWKAIGIAVAAGALVLLGVGAILVATDARTNDE